MPALNFQARFAPLVESGKKRQTIRALRKHPIRAGEQLYLFTGMRTKSCRRLLTAVCTRAAKISITATSITIEWPSSVPHCVNRQWESRPSALESFAIADGFRDWSELISWFKATHGLPFQGHLIEWESLRT